MMRMMFIVVHRHGACDIPSFGTDDPFRSASLSVPLTTRAAWRFLEQQTEEPSLGESQQERGREPKQQKRVPCCPHALKPESDASWGIRVCMQVLRDVHDEKKFCVCLACNVRDMRRARSREVVLSSARDPFLWIARVNATSVRRFIF